MKRTQASREQQIRRRQIGRKVLQADHLNHALNAGKRRSVVPNWKFLLARPRRTAAAGLVVVLVGAVGFGLMSAYQSQATTAQKAAVIQQQNTIRSKSAAAEVCRRQKAEQKADLIGKVTYDELYDYDECDK